MFQTSSKNIRIKVHDYLGECDYQNNYDDWMRYQHCRFKNFEIVFKIDWFPLKTFINNCLPKLVQRMHNQRMHNLWYNCNILKVRGRSYLNSWFLIQVKIYVNSDTYLTSIGQYAAYYMLTIPFLKVSVIVFLRRFWINFENISNRSLVSSSMLS